MWASSGGLADTARSLPWAAFLAVGVMVGACGSDPATPSPSTRPQLGSIPPVAQVDDSPTPARPPTASPVLTARTSATASPAPSVVATPAPSPIPSAAPEPTPLPRVGAAPAGRWTGIRWISVGKVLPKEIAEHFWPSVFGWSRGYVALAFDGDADGYGPTHLISSSSRDGVHWTRARTAPLPASLEHDGAFYGNVWIESVVEGHDGLLLVASDSGGTCGGPTTYDALWTSRDGVTWRAVDLPRAWVKSTIWSVAGGSTGFIAGGFASDGVTQSLWLSQDGRSWHRTRLPRSAGSKAAIDEVADFAAGYVVVGTIMTDGGCGGPSTITATVWWSPTGRWWARIPLGGPRPSRNITVSIVRVSDRKVIAVVDDPSGPDQAWVSTTGRRWTRIPVSRVPSPSGWIAGRPVSVWFPDEHGRATVTLIGPKLGGRALQRLGPGPAAKADDYDFPKITAGPTGVLVVSSLKDVWLGVPTKG